MPRKLPPPSPRCRLTDHAIARWVERVAGIDLDQLANQLITPEVKALLDAHVDGTVFVNYNGEIVRVICKSGMVVTVSPERPPVRYKSRLRPRERRNR